MEGDLQPLYLLLTDCYIYLLRKGNWLKIQVSLTLFGCKAGNSASYKLEHIDIDIESHNTFLYRGSKHLFFIL